MKKVEKISRIENDTLYTIDEIADFLKVNRVTIKDLIRNNKIRYFKVNSQYRFLGKNLLEYLNKNSNEVTK